MSESANTTLILEIYEAFNCGDTPAVLGYLDPQATLTFEATPALPWSGKYQGPQGFARFFELLAQNLDALTIDMQPFASEADRVVTFGRYQAVSKRSGNRIDSPLLHLWTLRNGKVLSCVELTNSAAEAAAL